MVSNQRRLPRLNTKQVFLLTVIFSPAQSFSSAENRFNSYLVVDGLSQSLFTTEIFFRGLHRDVAQQKLNLFQLAPGAVAEAGTRSSKVMRREFYDSNLCALYPANAGCEIGAQQSRICCFICQPSYGCQPDVDGPCSQVTIFEIKSVTEDDRLVERQSRSGAIPSHKLIDRMPITALRFERSQAYDHGDLGMLQIGKAELCFQSGIPALEFALHG